MDLVLDGKHNVIAYLPLDHFIEKICGRKKIQTEDLKKITEYVKPTVETEPEVQWFWEVFDEFDEKQKTEYLIFTQAKTRLPLVLNKDEFKHKIEIKRQSTKPDPRTNEEMIINARNSLPRAHTCFFQLELMQYDSKEKLRE